ncbi:MAG: hypothetical protein NWF04_01965 [Candidatus Bathyarchaeota archaeon]|nr:hypothetical protein [Candidatus Bathyarchaeota archaeon]
MASRKTARILASGLIIAAFAITLVSSGALSALTASKTLPSTGMLSPVEASVNIGIYSDITCTQEATALSWGTLEPGENTNQTVYIKNIGTADATLTMTTTNWSPQSAASSMTLTWNCEGRQIAPNEVAVATLTLAVSGNIADDITSFGFDVIITGAT